MLFASIINDSRQFCGYIGYGTYSPNPDLDQSFLVNPDPGPDPNAGFDDQSLAPELHKKARIKKFSTLPYVYSKAFMPV